MSNCIADSVEDVIDVSIDDPREILGKYSYMVSFDGTISRTSILK